MTSSNLIIILFSVSILLTDAAEVATSGSGKAIYTSARNPIASYFKEHKSKLRPYLARPASTESSSSLVSSPYGHGLSLHDETSAPEDSSNLYSHSNYYDANSAHDTDNYQAGSATSHDDKQGAGSYMDLYDSPSNPEYQASNSLYSVVDPLSSGYSSPSGTPPSSSSSANPGYYGGNPHHGVYGQPASYHAPGLPTPSSNTGNAGYYGASDAAHAHPPPAGGYANSIYATPQSANAPPTPVHSDNPLYGGNGSPAPAPTHHHHTPTSNNYNYHHDKTNEGSDNSDLFPITGGTGGYEPSDDEETIADNGYTYDYGTIATDDDTLMELPLFGGGGGASDAAAPPAADTTTPPENPLNFLNLVGTDFQPGRLVNIFFGLFIMLFMIIFHGYALWILGIAYLPGTRSLNQWEFDKDKVGIICNAVLDAIEYWENRID